MLKSFIYLQLSLIIMADSAFSFEPLFDARIDYVAGFYPHSVFSIDLDGDGDNDLAIANCCLNNYVSILLNNGDGTFQAAVNYSAGDWPQSVFSIDLDGDGDNDLAVANEYSHNVSIFLNNGDGTFPAAVNYGAEGPVSVFSIDLDGDADNDLAVANWYSDSSVSILFNLINTPSCCIGIRGNIDGSFEDAYVPPHGINIADLVYLVDFMFSQPPGPEPVCNDGTEQEPNYTEANVDGVGTLNIADLVYLVDYMFEQPPGPAPVDCP